MVRKLSNAAYLKPNFPRIMYVTRISIVAISLHKTEFFTPLWNENIAITFFCERHACLSL